MVNVSVGCDGCKVCGGVRLGPDFDDFFVGAYDEAFSIACTTFYPREIFDGESISQIFDGKGSSSADIVEEGMPC